MHNDRSTLYDARINSERVISVLEGKAQFRVSVLILEEKQRARALVDSCRAAVYSISPGAHCLPVIAAARAGRTIIRRPAYISRGSNACFLPSSLSLSRGRADC